MADSIQEGYCRYTLDKRFSRRSNEINRYFITYCQSKILLAYKGEMRYSMDSLFGYKKLYNTFGPGKQHSSTNSPVKKYGYRKIISLKVVSQSEQRAVCNRSSISSEYKYRCKN